MKKAALLLLMYAIGGQAANSQTIYGSRARQLIVEQNLEEARNHSKIRQYRKWKEELRETRTYVTTYSRRRYVIVTL